MDALITYAQLAEHYGIAITTMRTRVYRGDAPVPVLGPGGRVRGFRREEVEKYDAAHTKTRKEFLYA